MDGGWEAWRDRVAWGLLGVVLFGLVGYVLYRFIGTLTFALFVYYATRPLYRRLIRHFDHPDWVALGTLLAFTLPMLAVLAYATLVGVQELDQFLGSRGLEGYREMLQPYVDLAALSSPQGLVETVTTSDGSGLDPQIQGALEGLVGPVTTYAGFVLAVLIRVFLLFTFAFYLLRDDHKIAGWFRRSFDYDGAVAFARRVDEDLETVFFGNLMTIVATGAIAVGAYFALDWLSPGNAIAYPVLLGLLTGIATLVPVVGMKLVYIPYTIGLLALAATGAVPVWLPLAFFAVTFVVVDTFPDLFVRSYFSSGSLDMGLVLFAYVLGTLVFGWYGIFFGPILLVAFVHFAREIFPRMVSGDWIRA